MEFLCQRDISWFKERVFFEMEGIVVKNLFRHFKKGEWRWSSEYIEDRRRIRNLGEQIWRDEHRRRGGGPRGRTWNGKRLCRSTHCRANYHLVGRGRTNRQDVHQSTTRRRCHSYHTTHSHSISFDLHHASHFQYYRRTNPCHLSRHLLHIQNLLLLWPHIPSQLRIQKSLLDVF